MYPEFLIAPMREELTRYGVRELRGAADVDQVLTETPGTVMVVVNSVCGCAAGKARPGSCWRSTMTSSRTWSRPSSPAPTSKRPSGPELLRGLSALVAGDRHAPRWEDDLHDGAPSDREPDSGRHRPATHRRVRQVLREGDGFELSGYCIEMELEGGAARRPLLCTGRVLVETTANLSLAYL